MGFEYVKALHLIFIVTWFAGLFYIVRLFIYQTEALEKPEQERLILKPQPQSVLPWPRCFVQCSAA